MAVSPDGTRVAVSASTANTVHVLDIDTGTQLGSFTTGDKPHENIFTDDGRYLWNMSIGDVNTALDAPWLDWTKGDRQITVVDAHTFQQVKVIDMRARLDAFGLKDLLRRGPARRLHARTSRSCTSRCRSSTASSSTTSPPTGSPGSRPCRRTRRPATDRTTWVNDSRHHGMSMSPDGTKLCIAGTMDDYATVVDRATLQEGPLVPASKPYWATVERRRHRTA